MSPNVEISTAWAASRWICGTFAYQELDLLVKRIFWRCRIIISTTHCKCIQPSHAHPPTTSHHMSTEELPVNHSGCFDLPEIPEVFVQGFSSVHWCYVGQGEVLQLWEVSKRCSLQNDTQRRENKPGFRKNRHRSHMTACTLVSFHLIL